MANFPISSTDRYVKSRHFLLVSDFSVQTFFVQKPMDDLLMAKSSSKVKRCTTLYLAAVFGQDPTFNRASRASNELNLLDKKWKLSIKQLYVRLRKV